MPLNHFAVSLDPFDILVLCSNAVCAGWLAGWLAQSVIMIPLRGSILQAETCRIHSLAENPRWSQQTNTANIAPPPDYIALFLEHCVNSFYKCLILATKVAAWPSDNYF